MEENIINQEATPSLESKPKILNNLIILLICSILSGLIGYYIGSALNQNKESTTNTMQGTNNSIVVEDTSTPAASNSPVITPSNNTKPNETINETLAPKINDTDSALVYKTRPPLDLEIIIPKKAKYEVTTDNSEDWGIKIEDTSGVSIDICTGCQRVDLSCESKLECTTKEVVLGDMNFLAFSDKKNPQKLMYLIDNDSLRNKRDLVYMLKTKDNRQLSSADTLLLSNLIKSIK